MAGDAGTTAQVTADRRDERQTLDDLNLERLDFLLDVTHERVQRIVDVLFLHHGAKAIDTGGHVLDGDVIALEHRKCTAHKADAGLGAVAGHVDGDKAALAGHAGNDGLGLALVGRLANDGAGVLRRVGVLDDQRNTGLAHGEHGLLVQDARTHVRKLAQLLVGNAGDGLGLGHNARVGRIEARDVGPVLVQVGTQALGKNGTGNVAATTVEQLDLALAGRAVETGHDKAALLAILLHQLGRAVHAERTVMMERHDRRGIQERQAQILGHEAGGEVLAALLGGVATRAGALGKGRKLLADGIGEPQLVGDIKVALADVLEQLLTRHVVLDVRVDQVEQVGHLGVALKAATAGRNHHKTAGRVGVDDGLDLLEVFGIGDRRAAKLGNLNHGLEVTFLKSLCEPILRALIPLFHRLGPRHPRSSVIWELIIVHEDALYRAQVRWQSVLASLPTGVCLSRTSWAPSSSISARLQINRTLKSLKMCWECY